MKKCAFCKKPIFEKLFITVQRRGAEEKCYLHFRDPRDCFYFFLKQNNINGYTDAISNIFRSS